MKKNHPSATHTGKTAPCLLSVHSQNSCHSCVRCDSGDTQTLLKSPLVSHPALKKRSSTWHGRTWALQPSPQRLLSLAHWASSFSSPSSGPRMLLFSFLPHLRVWLPPSAFDLNVTFYVEPSFRLPTLRCIPWHASSPFSPWYLFFKHTVYFSYLFCLLSVFS